MAPLVTQKFEIEILHAQQTPPDTAYSKWEKKKSLMLTDSPSLRGKRICFLELVFEGGGAGGDLGLSI